MQQPGERVRLKAEAANSTSSQIGGRGDFHLRGSSSYDDSLHTSSAPIRLYSFSQGIDPGAHNFFHAYATSAGVLSTS
jgi:hypothetical protein